MAAYREHITVSTLLGVTYGTGAWLALGFSPVQGAMAGWLTALGGMLPDLDSESGRPVREMFGLVAAIAPLVLVGRVIGWLGLPGDIETVMLVIVILYLAIKYGGAALVGTLAVHRGMFHSLPALVIASEAVYLAYPSELTTVKLLMGCGMGLGFFSHLMLDELYSVEWSGARLKVKKSAGSALKMFSRMFVPNVVTYSLCAVTTYAMLVDAGLIVPRPSAPVLPQAEQRTLRTEPIREAEAIDLGEATILR